MCDLILGYIELIESVLICTSDLQVYLKKLTSPMKFRTVLSK